MNHRIFVSQITDPFINLAIENALLHQINAPSLFLYQNATSVVMGRAQNPWIETDVAFLKQTQIPLLRRQSGGGTVVHDLGNLNFSFLSPKTDFNKAMQIGMVQQAIASLGLNVQICERYDLFIADKKISGSAFRETKNNSFHHGTLLIHSDLEVLRRCLKVPPHQITTKAIASRRSAVMNLSEILPSLSPDLVSSALIAHFQALHQLSQNSVLFFDKIPAQFDIAATIALYQSEDWIYKRTLPFTAKIQLNNQPITISVESGVITKIEPLLPELKPLLGEDYHSSSITLMQNYKD